MRAEPWGLVRTDHGSSAIRFTPKQTITNVLFLLLTDLTVLNP